MSTLGQRLAIAELDDITTEVAALGVAAERLAERLEGVRQVLAGDVLDLRDRPDVPAVDPPVPERISA